MNIQNNLRRFPSRTEYDTFVASQQYVEPNVSTCSSGGDVIYNREPHHVDRILKFTSWAQESTVKLIWNGSTPSAVSLYYSINDGAPWNDYTMGDIINLRFGESVKFKGTNGYFSTSTSNYYRFIMTGRVSASGDLTSLLNGVGGDASLNGKNYCFHALFQACSSLTTAPNLPSTTLSQYCYSYMFQNCRSLVTAPALPATTLASYCYQNMFQGCTSLVTAPELPATTLAQSCYDSMFRGCTSLTTAPTLPATTLSPSCYQSMFNGCTSLTTAPELPATTLVNYCYRYMFQNCSNINYIKAAFTTTPGSSYTQNWVSGVSATGTFLKSSSASWDVTGVSGVPSGWTVQTYSPPMPK